MVVLKSSDSDLVLSNSYFNFIFNSLMLVNLEHTG